MLEAFLRQLETLISFHLKSNYLPSIRKTVVESNDVIPRLTFSPAPDGMKKPNSEIPVIIKHGKIKLNT